MWNALYQCGFVTKGCIEAFWWFLGRWTRFILVYFNTTNQYQHFALIAKSTNSSYKRISFLLWHIPVKKLTLIHVRLHVVRVGDTGKRRAWGGGCGQWCGGRVALGTAAAALRRNRCPMAVWNLQELTTWDRTHVTCRISNSYCMSTSS